jgi:MOSC domain-containing protein YiiM
MNALETDELTIVSVNVGGAKVLIRWDRDILSGIDKRPVATSTLRLSPLGLEGDVQADTRPTPAGGQVHGGPDQAVYAFPQEHYARIGELVGSDVWPGFMGENLTVAGAVEDDVHIGDVWAWGDARLQISAPRGPCFKMGIRMGKQALRTALRAEGLVGWYLRVLEPAVVPTSGHLLVVDSDRQMTVGRIHRAIQDRDNTYPELAAHPALAPNQKMALLVRGRDLSGGVPETD